MLCSPALVRWFLIFEALMVALVLMVCCGVIPEWGGWYAPDIPYRLQTEAFLHGHLALNSTPCFMTSGGLVWSESGVQQASGLGIPLWRLPFEIAARGFGQHGFPDRIALTAAFFLLVILIFQIWLEPLLTVLTRGQNETQTMPNWGAAIGITALLLFFPPFVNLLRTPLMIYEEVLVYVYIYGVGLMMGLLNLIRHPSRSKYWGICFLAGFGGLIRPTLVFYGLVTVILATIWMAIQEQVPHPRSDQRSAPSGWQWLIRFGKFPLWIGMALYFAGGLALFTTNQLRFGDGFEFGHRLNIISNFPPGVMFATRFNHPFQNEPLGSAARELIGALFSVKNLNGYNCYQPLIFPAQSETIRWRAFYFLTFDWIYALLVAAGWIWGIAFLFKRRRTQSDGLKAVEEDGIGKECVGVTLWSLGSALLLAVFYLRVPCLSSRYMMDFAPAFAGAIAAFWLKLSTKIFRSARLNFTVGLALLGILFGWIVLEIAQGRCSIEGAKSITYQEVMERIQELPAARLNLPEGTYTNGFYFRQTCIPQNGVGWGEAVAPVVVLFINDPEGLELEITAAEGKRLETAPVVQAKIGLEFLKEESQTKIGQIWLFKFAKPELSRYQNGIQPLFLAFGPMEKLTDQQTPYSLLRVSWKGIK